MNSALPWNINGVGIDARDAAREAARRQGKSLGEWLHGVIADHAESRGSEPRDMGGADRIEAVTARLARMGARGTVSKQRRPDRSRGDTSPSLRVVSTRDEAEEDDAWAPRAHSDRDRQRGPRYREDGEDLLDKAVAELDRRAERAERRTGEALASMAKLLEDNQARRDREAGDVAALTRKLGELETNLSQRFAMAANHPLEGPLARLEDRLDSIARRGAAEQEALQKSHVEEAEPLRRLEDKLNTILATLQPPRRTEVSQASVPAMEAVRAAAAPTPRRSLGVAIAEIARRQRSLEEPAIAAASRPAPTARARDPFAALHGELADLARKVDEMRRDGVPSSRAPQAPRGDDLATMRAEVAAIIAHSLGDLPQRGSIEALEGSIAALSERIEISRAQPVQPPATDLRQAPQTLDARATFDPRATIGDLERELRRIGDKVDRLEIGDGAGLQRLQGQIEALHETMTASATRPVPVERLEQQVAALADRLDRRTEAAPAAAAASLADQFGTIEQRLDHLAGRLDKALAAEPAAASKRDMRQLEAHVADLALRLDLARAPGADGTALVALQRQIEDLSERFARSESEISALPGLGIAIRDLVGQLDATRASVETTAARTARDVLKTVADEGRGPGGRPSEAVDARSRAALDKMQDMLGKVVDRLGGMEREIADVRLQPPVAAAADPMVAAPILNRPRPLSPRPPNGAGIPLGGMEPRVDTRGGGMEPRVDTRGGTMNARMPRQTEGQPGDRGRPAMPETARRTDYIAAARRAAAAAQAEAAAAQRVTPPAASTAGLVTKSRDYMATHRRPVLMGLGALILAIGTLVLVGRMGPTAPGSNDEIAAIPAPRTASLPVTPARTAARAQSDESGSLSPSAAPATSTSLADPIPGSDPIQTGSIPSLPSFAAAAPRQALPRGLIAAAGGGDAGAQFTLAALYAEGRVVPRNMQQAIGLFQKAADAGSAPAAYRLGLIFEKGLGVAIDKAKANALYTRAAEAGNTRAMHNLAVLLADGDGHPDYAGAVAWFRKAAQYGVHDSQFNLGVLLGRGLGVPQNLVQSYQWFAVAAMANDADAGRKRDEVAPKLAADDLAVAKALAASFKPRVADVAAQDVVPPPGGWDSAPAASRLNSARAKVSSL